MAEETHKLKNMRAIRSEGVLYVAEKDCRENVAEALAQKKPLLEKIAVLVAALEKIERWFGEFPPTGQTWDDGTPMSYAAAYGSNGERDYMRGVARAALEEAKGK